MNKKYVYENKQAKEKNILREKQKIAFLTM